MWLKLCAICVLLHCGSVAEDSLANQENSQSHGQNILQRQSSQGQSSQGQIPAPERFCNTSRSLTFRVPIACSVEITGDGMCPPGERFVAIETPFNDTHFQDDDESDDFDDLDLTTACPDSVNGTCEPGSGNVTADDNVTLTTPPSTTKREPVVDRSCTLVCAKDFANMAACCPGFYGTFCQPCPRGEDGQICSGRGHCRDGYYNDGTCQCQENFSGLVCELCSNSAMYGPSCMEECQCVHGLCDSGPTGNGTCRQCHPGYRGPLCTEEIITCDTLTCGNNSLCEENGNGQAECVCESGFEPTMDNSTDCQPINKCLDPSTKCGENSACIMTGPGTYECQCWPDYHGDGYMCLPINPCETNYGGCENETTVCINTAANKSQCDCMAGYERYVKGLGCTLINVCLQGSCHPKADCTTIAPYEFRCTCKEGYIGDGAKHCYGNIMQQLEQINTEHPDQRGQLTMAIDLLKSVYRKPLEEHGPFTIFVPNNRALRKASRRDFSYADMFHEKERSQQVLRDHILIGNLTLEDLQAFSHFYTLQGNIADLQVRVARNVFKYKIRGYSSRAKVIDKDLLASNGMIHIVNDLLINDPQIAGDPTATAMELIKKEGRFNRLQTLITSLGVESQFEKDNITVFAPENGGLDSLPEGTLDYLMKDEDGKLKLKTLLENHIFQGRIPVTDLVSMKRIHSIANYAFDVSVSNMGQIQLNGKVNISQANIPSSNAVYYHTDGPLIPPELADMLPNRCDVKKNVTVKGRCESCTGELSCPLDTDTRTNEISEGCMYWGHLQGRFTRIPGCQAICQRTHTMPSCCKGFYGPDCKPCPGGHKNPCSGHGECSDKMYGTGFCLCDRNFRGDRCELCMDRKMYGPNCTQDCTCEHGECDGGPEGSGLCKPQSCYVGYTGDNCQLEKKRCYGKQIVCHMHAQCVLGSDDKPKCECQRGYEGDAGKECTEINPCEKPDRGGCHTQAMCSKIGPGAHQCTCDRGWFGDGFTCHPVTPCTSAKDCHDNASCHNTGPGEYSCVCDKGFDGNGTFCTEIDACLKDNGGCDPLAECTPTGPGTVNCTCPENYAGSGQRCYTTLAGHIMAHENLTLLAGLLEKLDPDDVFLSDLGESFTFFAPHDLAVDAFMRDKVPQGYLEDPQDLINFFNFHTLTKDYTVDEMLALQGLGGFGRFETLFDGYSVHVYIKNRTVNVMSSQTTSAQILSRDTVALNGYLHIINGVLEPFLPDADQPFLREFFELNSDYSTFGSWLEEKDLISTLQQMDRYTLFVPDDSAFVPENLNRTITKDYLKYYIVPEIILTPSVDDNQTVDTLLGPAHQLEFTISGDQVLVNGVKIVRPNILTMEGVIHTISAPLSPTLNFCNRKTFKTDFGICGSCGDTDALQCEEGMEPAASPYIKRYACTYNITGATGQVYKYMGCQRLCTRHITIVQCCAGHYGTKCHECPGGPEVPCGGEERGLCDEGIGATGFCVCNTLYTGSRCQDCKDLNMAGPYCNISKLSCAYQNGNCSENADCVETESGDGVHCRCRFGYIGDGYQCTSLCDTSSVCHPNATCELKISGVIPETTCRCKPGFHGNGKWCVENVDRCETGESGCSMYSDCRYSPPPVDSEKGGEVTCSCLPGYTGNGTLCVTTVLNALSQIPAASAFYQALMTSYTAHNLTELLDNRQAAVTVYVPVGNSSLVSFSELRLDDYIIPLGLLTNQELVTESNGTGVIASSGVPLVLTLSDKQYFIEDVHILERNILATNGYINLIAAPYRQGNVKRPGTSSDLELVVIVVPIAVLVVIVLVIVGVLCYRHSQATGFLDIVKRFRKGSDGSMSFARLQAQEDASEESAQNFNPFSQPDNVNFDNPLYNDPESL